MSLLTICQDAAALVGVDAPSAVVASSDATSAQFGALAQVEGDELARYFDWRGLKIETTMTGDGSTVLFELPTGFDRWMSGGAAFFEDGTYDRLEGPVSDETFTAYQAANSDPSDPVWRMIGPDVEFFPALDTGVVITSLYLTGYWITAADGVTRKARWTLDSDLSTLPERLITLGVVWRWKRAKGLDYAEEYRTYQMERLKATRSDGGLRMLTLSSSFSDGPSRKNAYRVI